MRTAIFALTEQGAALARRMQGILADEADVYLPEKVEIEGLEQGRIYRFSQVRAALHQAFSQYDALICIMATGIVVRILAPVLRDKLTDPAVLVCDERGNFVISLLSGHVGGANTYACRLAAAVGAQPVITTATDTEGELAPDVLAEKLALRPWPRNHIKVINSAILAPGEIRYMVSEDLPHRDFYLDQLRKLGLKAELCIFSELPQPTDRRCQVALVPKEQMPNLMDAPERTLYLVPRRLIAGVGCRQGVSKELVLQALDDACARIGRDRSFISVLASVSIKKDEAGLLEAAETLGVPINFYEPKVLQQQIDAFHLLESGFVLENVGAGNVCEAAALRESLNEGPGARFALPKTKYEKVTVALLWQK